MILPAKSNEDRIIIDREVMRKTSTGQQRFRQHVQYVNTKLIDKIIDTVLNTDRDHLQTELMKVISEP